MIFLAIFVLLISIHKRLKIIVTYNSFSHHVTNLFTNNYEEIVKHHFKWSISKMSNAIKLEKVMFKF